MCARALGIEKKCIACHFIFRFFFFFLFFLSLSLVFYASLFSLCVCVFYGYMLNITRAIAHLTKHARDTNAITKKITTRTAMFSSSLRIMDSNTFRSSSSFVSTFCKNEKSWTKTTRRRNDDFTRKKRTMRTSIESRFRDSESNREKDDPSKDWSQTIRGISGDHVHPSHLISEDILERFTDSAGEKGGEEESENVFELPRKKIPCAIVFAYVGNDFKGNTQNVLLPRGSTVDDVIEDAIFNAGGILLPNYRSKGLQRLKWSRSSRTDKGVSSLFTVVGLRMEAPVRAYGGSVGDEEKSESDKTEEEMDAEAKALIVEKINRHLPTDTVKAFACFKATKSFDARRAAISRTYEYLLPLKCLRNNKNGELEVFREALKTFEGAHPFHNYTKRGLYGAGKANDNRGKGKRNKKKEAVAEDDGLGETSSEEEKEEEEEKEDEEKQLPKRIETSGKHTYWLLEKDVDDLVHIMHYRRIHEFTCSKEPEVIEGFESYPFVRVKVYGESFMLHQIRKMIATAVLVALDSEETPTMPLSFIKASLCRPCRVVTPMAPPLTLFLTGAEFMSFRKTNHLEVVQRKGAAAATEKEELRSLTISKDTEDNINKFRRERLYPKLAESFASEDWDFFIENVQNVEPTREEYVNIVKQYESYDEVRQIRAKEKAEAEREEEEEMTTMREKATVIS